MKTIFDEAENNKNYDELHKAIGEEQKIREGIEKKQTELKGREEKNDTLQLGISKVYCMMWLKMMMQDNKNIIIK